MRMGKVDLSNIHYVPEDLAPRISRYTVDAGDLYISCAGTLGIVGLVPEVLHGANLTENANRISGIQIAPNFLLHVLMSEKIQGHIQNIQTVGAQPKLALGRIRSFEIPCPDDPDEQEAIAEALSDAEALIEGLERLIAKKRLIKQGAMQDLLTAKRRLPGFSGEWAAMTLFEMADSNKKNFDDGDWIEAEHIAPTGMRLIQTGNIGIGQFINSNRKYIFPESFRKLRCKEVHPGDVLVCRLADPPGRACTVPDLGEEKMLTSVDVTIFRPNEGVADRKLLTEFMSQSCWFARVDEASGGTTRKRIARSNLGRMALLLPPINEQQVMSALVTDMDAEIQALETRLDKARQVKEGMMQNLLTGRIRLI